MDLCSARVNNVKCDFLVTVDYWSNFLEVDQINNSEASTVIWRIKAHLARHGIQEEVETDNGPQFTSMRFKEFATEWMFKHVCTSLYYPQANGMAESAAKTAKKITLTAVASGSDPWLAFLAQRNTRAEGMITSPAERQTDNRSSTIGAASHKA